MDWGSAILIIIIFHIRHLRIDLIIIQLRYNEQCINWIVLRWLSIFFLSKTIQPPYTFYVHKAQLCSSKTKTFFFVIHFSFRIYDTFIPWTFQIVCSSGAYRIHCRGCPFAWTLMFCEILFSSSACIVAILCHLVRHHHHQRHHRYVSVFLDARIAQKCGSKFL